MGFHGHRNHKRRRSALPIHTPYFFGILYRGPVSANPSDPAATVWHLTPQNRKARMGCSCAARISNPKQKRRGGGRRFIIRVGASSASQTNRRGVEHSFVRDALSGIYCSES